MFFKQWEVLLADDDPDVNSITKLAMRNIEVYGVPLKLNTATSKAEAVELLETSLEWLPLLAVAFVDVVMETDSAGLDLIDYIRNRTGNRLTQIYVRTGQPGAAPERQLIDDYDINGYFTKVETTEDKLYSLVKAGVRQYLWNHFASGAEQWYTHLLAAIGSRERLAVAAAEMLRGFVLTSRGTKPDSMEVEYCVWIGGREVTRLGIDEQGALQRRDRLSQMPQAPLSEGGDEYVKDDRNDYLLHIASSDPSSELYYFCNTQFALPPNILHTIYQGFAGLSRAWDVSGADVASLSH